MRAWYAQATHSHTYVGAELRPKDISQELSIHRSRTNTLHLDAFVHYFHSQCIKVSLRETCGEIWQCYTV